MAEGALITVVASIVKVLGTPAFKELGNFWGHKNKFEKLENTMRLLEAVIQDAEAKQVDSRQIKHWLERLEDAVYEVDNLLDEFQTEALRRQVMPGSETTKKVRTFLSNSNQIAFQVKMGLKLRKVRKTLKAIKDDSVFGTLTQQEPHTEHAIANNRETHSFVRDEEVIGRDDDKMNIIKRLLGSDSDSQEKDNVTFLPIVGMGGLGKTTLAQLVYNDEMVKKHFTLQIWVCISDVFELKIIVEKMLKSINGSVQQGLELDQLQKSLRETVSGKRFLLILDDVWNEDREKWLKLKTLLMDGSRGSAVLITTRSIHIAQMMETIEPYELQGLDKNQSWSLFRKVAFERGQEPHNSNIVRIGEEIVKECKGVPLAIRTIGSILYGNNQESDWVSFKNNKLAMLPHRPQNDLGPILQLSYDCLDSHLKNCFAYCRLFPKDHVIDVQKLIKLWTAQDFVKPSDENECLEDIGYGYFVYLLGRSFFQEVEKDDLGTIETCKMHDLMHDLAISVAGERSIIVDQNSVNAKFRKKIRHISFDDVVYDRLPMSLWKGKKLVRTFLLPKERNKKELSPISCEAILSNLECLRALDLKDLHIRTLPNSFDKVKHLRYLDLSHNDMMELPSSITGLYNLQTLILTHCSKLLSLPRNLKYMLNLRHLLIAGCESLTHMPSELGELTSLRTLDRFFVVDNNTELTDCAGFAELGRLNELRGELVIEKLRHNYQQGDHAARSEAANLKEKQHLQCLCLLWNDDVSDITEHDEILLGGLKPHSNLKEFEVRSYMGVKFPTWLSLLTNLVSLHLCSCRNLQYLPSLDQSMSHLKELELSKLNTLEHVNSETDYSQASRKLFFPRLERLNIEHCPNLKGWWKRSGPVGLTAIKPMIRQNHPFLPCLFHLSIKDCPNLISMPLFPNVKNLYLFKTSSIPLQETVMLMKPVSSTSPLASTSSVSNSSIPTPLSRLHRLTLVHVEDIEFLPEGIFSLSPLLTFLDIQNCCKLDNLPEEMANLSSLEEFHVSDCSNLTSLPKGIGNLSSLEKLHVSNCPSLTSLPKEIGNLSSLEELHVRDCPNLVSLPEGISNLSSFKDLCIKRCDKMESLPKGLHGFTFLKKLCISECPNLLVSSEGIANLLSLTRLAFKRCDKLALLPEGMGNLSSLERLTLKGWDKLATLPQWLQGLTSLKRLDIKECPNLESLSEGISNLSSLESLTLVRCDKLALLPQGIGNLSSLKSLKLTSCDKLATLPQGLHGLTSLHNLSIYDCPNLGSLLEGIVNLSSLTSLTIGGSDKLTTLPQGLHSLTSLSELSIVRCQNLESLPEEIAQLPSLKRLILKRCDTLATLPQKLHHITSLHQIRIIVCPLLSQTIKEDRYGHRAMLAQIPSVSIDWKPIHAGHYPTCL